MASTRTKKRTWPLTTVVEVHWYDANARSSWGSAQEYVEHDIAPVVSIGYPLKDTKKPITLVSSCGVDWDDCNGAISIPQTWIAKKKVLRK